MEALELLGIGSALLALLAFVGNEYGKLKAESFAYDCINLVSGLGLFTYAYMNNVVPFMITNSIWALISGIDVVKYALRKARKGRKSRAIRG